MTLAQAFQALNAHVAVPFQWRRQNSRMIVQKARLKTIDTVVDDQLHLNMFQATQQIQVAWLQNRQYVLGQIKRFFHSKPTRIVNAHYLWWDGFVCDGFVRFTFLPCAIDQLTTIWKIATGNLWK